MGLTFVPLFKEALMDLKREKESVEIRKREAGRRTGNLKMASADANFF